jgi:hypothetical protein
LDDGVVLLAKLDGMSKETLHPGHRITDPDGNLRELY